MNVADCPPRIPEGSRIYAVGDVHGRADLLALLHRLIVEDAAVRDGAAKAVVYLGDYVDRGPASAAVIDMLAGDPLPGFAATFLKGNHEDMLMRFLDDGSTAAVWFTNGGIATLASYGIEASPRLRDAAAIEAVRRSLRDAMGPTHLDFLRRLKLSHGVGDYFFAHAGVRPGVPLERQDPQDLMWIRHAFLDWPDPFARMIVHGHSISPVPEVRANRIGIDTGAYASGCLTCLVLEGASRRLLRT
jgi:serine/threonine protein phosphatase 1